MPVKRASVKSKLRRVFGHPGKRPKTALRAALYARVSSHDQQTLPMQNRALRDYAARRGCRRTLLAQNVEQSELAWHGPVGAIPADQGTVSSASTKTALLLPRAAGYRHTVNQPLTSP